MAEETDQAILKRITVPLVWAQLEYSNIKILIEDLEPDRFEDGLRTIKRYFVPVDILCRCVRLKKDEVSLTTYLDRIHFNMKDSTSLAAVVEDSKKIIGVLVNRVLRKAEHSRTQSKVKLALGDSVQKIIHIQTTILARSNVFETYNIDSCLQLYILCIKSKYRGRGINFYRKLLNEEWRQYPFLAPTTGIGLAMIRAGIELAKSLKLGAVIGIFTTGNAQEYARSLGMETLSEIYYIDWIIDGEMIFDDPGPGNYSIALMGKKISYTDEDMEKTIN